MEEKQTPKRTPQQIMKLVTAINHINYLKVTNDSTPFTPDITNKEDQEAINRLMQTAKAFNNVKDKLEECASQLPPKKTTGDLMHLKYLNSTVTKLNQKYIDEIINLSKAIRPQVTESKNLSKNLSLTNFLFTIKKWEEQKAIQSSFGLEDFTLKTIEYLK
jgi:hypothetical protein